MSNAKDTPNGEMPGTAGAPINRIANSENRVKMPRRSKPDPAGAKSRAEYFAQAGKAIVAPQPVEEESEEEEEIRRKPGRPRKVVAETE